MTATDNINNLFNEFIETCIIRRTEYITNGTEEIFNETDIKDCFNALKQAEKEVSFFADGEKFQKLMLHCYWLMNFFGDNKAWIENVSVYKKKKNEKGERDEHFFPKDVIASTGQAYTGVTNKNVILFILSLIYNLIQEIKNKEISDVEKAKETMLGLIANKKKKNKSITDIDGEEIICNPIANILLHLCKPEIYVPIVAQSNKDAIFGYLGFLSNYKEYNEEAFMEIEKKLKKIKENESFYDKTFRPFWDSTKVSTNVTKDGDLGMEALLRYKRSIVLYGPPGTGKSYTARELAISLITKTFAKKLKSDNNKEETFSNFIKKEDIIFGRTKGDVLPHIHYLQLHPNYTYDDFIVGKTIWDNNVDIQKGYLLNLIDEIKKDRDNHRDFADLPHIVILDEINRVDISRVFGELFTAMESDYREDGVELPASIIHRKGDNGEIVKTKPLRLIVPEDLYFIGTMNQIDFSLEQVDFALRRRFAWIESTFDKDKLEEIINERLKKKGHEFPTIDKYISTCINVNKEIENETTLGKEYWIGHAFFAEIVDIYDETQVKDWGKAKELLWHISIKPMIEAYCGSMDSSTKENFIKNCKNAFMPKEKQGKDQTNPT